MASFQMSNTASGLFNGGMGDQNNNHHHHQREMNRHNRGRRVNNMHGQLHGGFNDHDVGRNRNNSVDGSVDEQQERGEGLNQGPWSQEEDVLLEEFVHRHGERRWAAVGRTLNRTAKSCRLRWVNQLSPDVNHSEFTKEEDQKLISLHAKLGSKWSFIARKLPGRTDNQVKNRWNSKFSKMMQVEQNQQQASPPRGPVMDEMSSQNPNAANLNKRRRSGGAISGAFPASPIPAGSQFPDPNLSAGFYVAPGDPYPAGQFPKRTAPIAQFSAAGQAPEFDPLTSLSLCIPSLETDDIKYPDRFLPPHQFRNPNRNLPQVEPPHQIQQEEPVVPSGYWTSLLQGNYPGETQIHGFNNQLG